MEQKVQTRPMPLAYMVQVLSEGQGPGSLISVIRRPHSLPARMHAGTGWTF